MSLKIICDQYIFIFLVSVMVEKKTLSYTKHSAYTRSFPFEIVLLVMPCVGTLLYTA